MSCSIYCIEDCNGLKYVGQTISTLPQRLAKHKYDKKKRKDCSSHQLDLDNCEIKLLETCDISHRKEREIYWINHINCVNILKLNHDNKKYMKEYFKKYSIKNKDKKKEYDKKYREKNMEKNKEYKKQLYNYQKSWGGDLRADNNSLLKIDITLFQ